MDSFNKSYIYLYNYIISYGIVACYDLRYTSNELPLTIHELLYIPYKKNPWLVNFD